jgi:hypothetical protein
VVFSGGIRFVPAVTWPPPPPYGAPFSRIPGGVAIQCSGGGPATSGFAVVQRRIWWPDDEDYVTTGHLAGLNTRIYQPAIGRGNEAGHIIARPGRIAHADVARVGIADARVHPRIHVGHGVQRPVFSSGDPGVNERVWDEWSCEWSLRGGKGDRLYTYSLWPRMVVRRPSQSNCGMWNTSQARRLRCPALCWSTPCISLLRSDIRNHSGHVECKWCPNVRCILTNIGSTT